MKGGLTRSRSARGPVSPSSDSSHKEREPFHVGPYRPSSAPAVVTAGRRSRHNSENVPPDASANVSASYLPWSCWWKRGKGSFCSGGQGRTPTWCSSLPAVNAKRSFFCSRGQGKNVDITRFLFSICQWSRLCSLWTLTSLYRYKRGPLPLHKPSQHSKEQQKAQRSHCRTVPPFHQDLRGHRLHEVRRMDWVVINPLSKEALRGRSTGIYNREAAQKGSHWTQQQQGIRLLLQILESRQAFAFV